MKKKRYTPGLQDIERTFEALENQYKQAKRERWLKERYKKHGRRRSKSKESSPDVEGVNKTQNETTEEEE